MAIADCDVLVVGGGPAGLAVAIELRRRGGLTVVVVERSSYDRPRIGETLSPGAGALLTHLGAMDGFAADGHVPAYGTAAAWGSPELAIRDFLMTPFGTGWHLDRRRFDARLAETAEQAGVAVWRQSRIGRVAERPDGFAVAIEREGKVDDVQARFLVDASGKAAAVARRLGAGRLRADRQVATVGTFVFPGEPPAASQTLVEPCELGWWYSANLPEGRMVAALITDADLVRVHRLADDRVWRSAVHALPHTGPRLVGGRLLAPPRVVAAYSACLVPATGPRWLAVGDAAASHDPLSASGIVRALESGIHAGEAIHAALVLGRSDALSGYAQRQHLAFDQYRVTRATYYQMENRWPGAIFWRRRQRHVTLDPTGWLEAVPINQELPAVALPADLYHIDAGLLLAVADPCGRAHEMVSAYQAHAAQPAADLDVVLALQWLLARGALRAIHDREVLDR